MRRTPLKRKTALRPSKGIKWRTLGPASKKRMKQNREYYEKRREFLKAHRYCQWFIREHGGPEPIIRNGGLFFWTNGSYWQIPLATDIHHMAGRVGKLLLDERYWMAVSREGHNWIHAHPKEAEAKGYIVRLTTEEAIKRECDPTTHG